MQLILGLAFIIVGVWGIALWYLDGLPATTDRKIVALLAVFMIIIGTIICVGRRRGS